MPYLSPSSSPSSPSSFFSPRQQEESELRNGSNRRIGEEEETNDGAANNNTDDGDGDSRTKAQRRWPVATDGCCFQGRVRIRDVYQSWFFSYMAPILRKGCQQAKSGQHLVQDDLFAVPDFMKARVLVATFWCVLVFIIVVVLLLLVPLTVRYMQEWYFLHVVVGFCFVRPSIGKTAISNVCWRTYVTLL
jgi:hypothetical protein